MEKLPKRPKVAVGICVVTAPWILNGSTALYLTMQYYRSLSFFWINTNKCVILQTAWPPVGPFASLRIVEAGREMKDRSSESLRSQTVSGRRTSKSTLLMEKLPKKPEVAVGICVLIALYLANGEEARFVCHLLTCVPAALLNVWMLWNGENPEQVNFMLLYWAIQGVLVVADSVLCDIVCYYVIKFAFLTAMLVYAFCLDSEECRRIPLEPHYTEQSRRSLLSETVHDRNMNTIICNKCTKSSEVSAASTAKSTGLNPPGSSQSSLLSETIDNLSKNVLIPNKRTKSSEVSAASTAKTPPPNASETKSQCSTARNLTMTLGKSTRSSKEAPNNNLITTPGDTLTFVLPNRQQCVLYISNNSGRCIMWATKTNSRKRIAASPSYGVLPAGSAIKVAVDLLGSSPSTKEDRLSIDYIFVDDVYGVVQQFDQKLFLDEKVGRERKNFVMRTISLILLLSTILAAIYALGVGRTQSAGVRGTLMCNDRPAAHVKVKLYDDDRGIDADDLMAEGKSDSQGKFELKGHTSEFTPIDPKLNVYHDCNDGVTPCQRKITIMLPDSYITDGKVPQRVYDAGVIQLAGKFPGETRDCLN
ncbi:hypothetical protein QR680_004133 [Steinernema hermaphroditum]|uniref:MSP domain-containing protein n=1 Tax=Steinernema hermaphroditum TaxID=289476 RepID=A0AA39HPZ5_9BILA|nr:hypothetical protein QR680_004133 [Steinernema hermaphroditum]